MNHYNEWPGRLEWYEMSVKEFLQFATSYTIFFLLLLFILYYFTETPTLNTNVYYTRINNKRHRIHENINGENNTQKCCHAEVKKSYVKSVLYVHGCDVFTLQN